MLNFSPRQLNLPQTRSKLASQRVPWPPIPLYTLMLLLFASTKFCDFGILTILRVLYFAISRSPAKFCDFAQPKVKAFNFETHWLSKCGSLLTEVAATYVHVVFL